MISPALLLSVVVVAGPIPKDLQLNADGRVLERTLRAAHHTVDLALGRHDAFPSAGPPDNVALTRQTWASLLDHLVALDGTSVWYAARADDSGASPQARDGAWVLAYVARLGLATTSMAFVDGAVLAAEVESLLDEGDLDRGLPAGTLNRLVTEVQRPEALAFVVPGYRRFRGSVARLDLSSPMLAWIRSYVAKARRMLARRTRDAPARIAFEPWFDAADRVSAWPVAGVSGSGHALPMASLKRLRSSLRPGDVVLVRRTTARVGTGRPGFWHEAVFYVGPPSALNAVVGKDRMARAFLRRRGSPGGRLSPYLSRRFPQVWRSYDAASKVTPGADTAAVPWSGAVFLPLHVAAAGDAVAVLRPKVTPLQRARALALVFHHAGLPFDYGRTLKDARAIDGAELVQRVYTTGDGVDGILVPTEAHLGRTAVALGRLASEAARGDGSFEVVAFMEGDGPLKTGAAAVDSVVLSAERDAWELAPP